MTPHYHWQQDDDHKLSEYYIQGYTVQEIAQLMGRTVSAVKRRASDLGLKRVRHDGWTANELEQVRIGFRQGTSVSEIALSLGRSETATLQIARKHGIKHKLRKNFWSREETSNLTALKRVGHSVKEIACKLGRTENGIKHQSRRLGLSRTASPYWSKSDENILREKYGTTTSLEELAAILGRTVAATKIRAQQLDLRRREPLRIQRDYFQIIGSNIQAYLLGLIAADGFVSSKNQHYSLGLQLQARDLMLIERFRDGIAPESSIIAYPNSFRVTISSKELVSDLARFGIVPCKFAQMEWPNLLPEQYAAPFLLGYFDGDGSLYQSAHSHRLYWNWSLVGTEQFLTEAKKQIKRLTDIDVRGPVRNDKNRSPHLFALRASRQRDIEILDSALNIDNLGLPRKHLPRR